MRLSNSTLHASHFKFLKVPSLDLKYGQRINDTEKYINSKGVVNFFKYLFTNQDKLRRLIPIAHLKSSKCSKIVWRCLEQSKKLISYAFMTHTFHTLIRDFCHWPLYQHYTQDSNGNGRGRFHIYIGYYICSNFSLYFEDGRMIKQYWQELRILFVTEKNVSGWLLYVVHNS
jgi:hypothetical protein